MRTHPAVLRLAALVLLAGAVAAVVVALWRDATERAQSAARLAAATDEASALRCSDRNAKGVGLQADYFADAGLQGARLLSRIDPTVEYDAQRDWPAAGPAARPRSARWEGWIKAPLSGRFRFHAEPAATVRVSDQRMAGLGAAPDAAIELTAGRFYPIVMTAELSDAVGARLEWTAPHGVRYVIPRALLFLPSPKAASRAPAQAASGG